MSKTKHKTFTIVQMNLVRMHHHHLNLICPHLHTYFILHAFLFGIINVDWWEGGRTVGRSFVCSFVYLMKLNSREKMRLEKIVANVTCMRTHVHWICVESILLVNTLIHLWSRACLALLDPNETKWKPKIFQKHSLKQLVDTILITSKCTKVQKIS